MLESYLIRMDLWIEGYRQNAVLDKLEDGTTTISVYYDVPPVAIKSQAKQMVLDLLSDQVTLARLQEAAGEELSQLLLNPSLQSYYFSAIDALPLASNMTIGRTVSLEGDTLELHLSLPLYDAEGGEVTLRYDRTRGEGDLPDDNTISLESELRAISLTYQEYSSMTGGARDSGHPDERAARDGCLHRRGWCPGGCAKDARLVLQPKTAGKRNQG